jgi:hypothetical protein
LVRARGSSLALAGIEKTHKAKPVPTHEVLEEVEDPVKVDSVEKVVLVHESSVEKDGNKKPVSFKKMISSVFGFSKKKPVQQPLDSTTPAVVGPPPLSVVHAQLVTAKINNEPASSSQPSSLAVNTQSSPVKRAGNPSLRRRSLQRVVTTKHAQTGNTAHAVVDDDVEDDKLIVVIEEDSQRGTGSAASKMFASVVPDDDVPPVVPVVRKAPPPPPLSSSQNADVPPPVPSYPPTTAISAARALPPPPPPPPSSSRPTSVVAAVSNRRGSFRASSVDPVPLDVNVESVTDDIAILTTTDGRRLSIRAVSANAPLPPLPPQRPVIVAAVSAAPPLSFVEPEVEAVDEAEQNEETTADDDLEMQAFLSEQDGLLAADIPATENSVDDDEIEMNNDFVAESNNDHQEILLETIAREDVGESDQLPDTSAELMEELYETEIDLQNGSQEILEQQSEVENIGNVQEGQDSVAGEEVDEAEHDINEQVIRESGECVGMQIVGDGQQEALDEEEEEDETGEQEEIGEEDYAVNEQGIYGYYAETGEFVPFQGENGEYYYVEGYAPVFEANESDQTEENTTDPTDCL